MVEVLSGAEPFRFDNSEGARVLVLHGFTGTTQSMRYLGEELHRRFGFSVLGPRLKGHGTSPDDMATTGYADWVASAEEALQDLATGGSRVFVAGLSMGGTLSLNLAARYPDIVAGIIPINGCGGRLAPEMGALTFDRTAPERIPGIGSDIKAPGVTELAYSEVPVRCIREASTLMGSTGNLMPSITCPVQIIQSREDHIVPPENATLISQGVASRDVRVLWLDDSYHVATLDNDKDLIVERTGRFIDEISGDL